MPASLSLPDISAKDYHREPCPATVVSTPGVNLTNLNIVINTTLEAVICLSCHQPILPPSKLLEHTRTHIPEIKTPQEVVGILVERFSLGDTIQYPTQPIEPIFGLPLLEEPHFFCDKCGCGYHRLTGIQTHQASASDRCKGTTYHQGYGQLVPGVHRRIIEVKLDKLKKKKDVKLDYDSWLHSGIMPQRDYTKIPIAVPENTSNLSSFFYSDGWLKHLEGHTAEELFDARREHKAEETHGDDLREAAKRYLDEIQPKIQENVNFGLLKDIGSTTPYVYFTLNEYKY